MSHIPGLSFSMERGHGLRIWLGILSSAPAPSPGTWALSVAALSYTLVPVPLLRGHEAGEKHREDGEGGSVGSLG